jgi:hypothetical protein
MRLVDHAVDPRELRQARRGAAGDAEPDDIDARNTRGKKARIAGDGRRGPRRAFIRGRRRRRPGNLGVRPWNVPDRSDARGGLGGGLIV